MSLNKSFFLLITVIGYFVITGCVAPKPDSPRLSRFSDYTYVTSSPEQVTCNYWSKSSTITGKSTPHFLNISVLPNPIKLVCSKAGFWDSSIIIAPIYGTTFFDRISLGKYISLDSASYTESDIGPFKRLPRKIHVVLRKNIFKTINDRDNYYAEEALFAKNSWMKVLNRLEKLCKEANRGKLPPLQPGRKSCFKARTKIEEMIRNDMIIVEQQRRRSITQ